MKLNNLPLIRKRMAILGVTAFAAAGAAQAQFTGIGTVNPQATLHVVPVTVGDEVLQIDNVIDLTTETSYSDVLLHDPATGLFRRESISDLLANNGEFTFNAANEIVPRRAGYETNLVVGAGALSIGVPTSISGDTDVAGTFEVTGNSTLTGNLSVTDVAAVAAGDLIGTDEVLIQQAGTNLVEYVTVTDLISNASYWVNSGTVAAPVYQPRGIESTLSVGGGSVAVTGDVSVTGNAAITGTSSLGGAVTLGSVAEETAPTNATQVLIQDATGVIQYVDADALLSSGAIWEYDDVTAPTFIQPVAYNGAMTINASLVDINVNTDIAGTLDVSAAAAFAASASVGTTLDVGTVVDNAAGLDGADKVLIQDATTDPTRVQYVTVTDLISNSSYWAFDAATNTLKPADTDIADEFSITPGNIGVVGALGVTGNTTVDGTVTLTPGADGLTVNDLTAVTDVVSAGVGTTTGSVFERVMITDHDGFVRYIDADDLVASASEWVFDDADSDGVFDAADKVYVRRLGNDGSGDDVYVDSDGNFVVSQGKAYQFGSDADQITASATSFDITASANASFTTGAESTVAFTETGNTNPWLYYAGNQGATAADEVGRVGINTATPAATLHVAGNIVASNSTVTSDRRFKRDVEDFSGALEAVKALRGVSYSFRGDEFPEENFDDAEHLGFIAQEIREILPQTVVERGDGYLTVDYAAVTPVLAEALEELAAKVEALEAENASLKASPAVGAAGVISQLEARIADLDARLDEVAGRK